MSAINRVIYHLWHDLSDAGRVGYIGKDSHWPRRSNLRARVNDRGTPKLCHALQKYPIEVWHVDQLTASVDDEEALNRAEMEFIFAYDSKNQGYNCTDGGEGVLGHVHSAESRAKMSAANKAIGENNPFFGKKHTAETRAKLSAVRKGKSVNKGAVRSAEHRAKISAALKGRPGHAISDEARAKISATLKGTSKTWLIGKPLSAEHRAKLSAVRKGKKHSAESRAKMSIAQKGRVLTAEHRVKTSATMKDYLAQKRAATALLAA